MADEVDASVGVVGRISHHHFATFQSPILDYTTAWHRITV